MLKLPTLRLKPGSRGNTESEEGRFGAGLLSGCVEREGQLPDEQIEFPEFARGHGEPRQVPPADVLTTIPQLTQFALVLGVKS